MTKPQKKVRINEYGHIDTNGCYEVTLQGSYHYSILRQEYAHETLNPPIPLKFIYSPTILV